MKKLLKKNFAVAIWAIASFIIMAGAVLAIDGYEGLWGILEPGITGATIGGLLRAFVFTQKIKAREYAAKAANSDFVLIVQVNRPVVEAMKQVLGSHIEPDAIIDAKTMFGSTELSVPQMTEMVKAAYKALAPNQHCTIRLFLQGPQYIGVEFGRLTGLSFNMVTYTYNTASGNYEAGEPADRTWMV